MTKFYYHPLWVWFEKIAQPTAAVCPSLKYMKSYIVYCVRIIHLFAIILTYGTFSAQDSGANAYDVNLQRILLPCCKQFLFDERKCSCVV